MGLTSLAHSRLPLSFWGYALSTVVYLINRLPTSVLQNKTSFESLFQTTPDYHLLKTFGSSCFPYTIPYNTQKFQYKSIHYVFIGYSANHKGYLCLDLSSSRVYISRHVVFDENTFPYSTFI